MDEKYAQHLERVRARRAQLREALAAQFPEPVELTVELGCGHGHYLTAYAEMFPGEQCVGLDIINQRVRKANQKREKRGLRNLQFVRAEANEFLLCLPPHVVLRRSLILFNDPWPKARHHKNRLIQPAFLHLLGRFVPEGAPLYFRTDHEGFFAWTVEHLEAHPCWQIDPAEPWRFEAGSIFQGYAPAYQSLVALRTGAPADMKMGGLLQPMEEEHLGAKHREG
ncbi:MAG: tRNA (guanine-N7-)-methyltransferase [Puniceicoccaceae bacterium 5H]|nr:MAG: tRNA (guanine-N7-)-methyltransferase [Puniceicoccaceae bacterium 5H]